VVTGLAPPVTTEGSKARWSDAGCGRASRTVNLRNCQRHPPPSVVGEVHPQCDLNQGAAAAGAPVDNELIELPDVGDDDAGQWDSGGGLFMAPPARDVAALATE